MISSPEVTYYCCQHHYTSRVFLCYKNSTEDFDTTMNTDSWLETIYYLYSCFLGEKKKSSILQIALIMLTIFRYTKEKNYNFKS